jgi:hypothetical protein
MHHHSKSESKANCRSNAEPHQDQEDPLTPAQRDFACFLGRLLAEAWDREQKAAEPEPSARQQPD